MARTRRGIRIDPDKPIPDTPIRCPSTPDLPGTEWQLDAVYRIPVGDLLPDPDPATRQPREDFDPEALAALAADLAAAGQETPITFRVGTAADGSPQLYIVHGERRWRAAALAGIPVLLAILDRHAADAGETAAGRILRQVTHNEQQQAHSQWDWACICRRLSEPPHSMRVSDIAAELERRGIKGKSRPVVSTLIALHRLPEWAIDLVRDGRLTVAHGKYLLPHIERMEVMGELRGWLSVQVHAAAAADEEIDGKAPRSIQDAAMREPSRITVAQLRAEILAIYRRLYFPLGSGRWLKDGLQGDEYLLTRFEWQSALCALCKKRIEIDGQTARESFCPDTECVRQLNAAELESQLAAAREQDRQDRQARQAAGLPAAHRLDADTRRTEARQAADKKAADIEAIKTALSESSAETAGAVLLWRLLNQDMTSLGEGAHTPTLAKLAASIDISSIRRDGKLLLQSRARLSMSHFMAPEDISEIAAFLGLDLTGSAPAEPEPEATVAPLGPHYVDPLDASLVYVRGVLPDWMKEKMQSQGYDPAVRADREAFKSNYLILRK